MNRAAILIVFAMLTGLSGSGCGTMANIEGRDGPFLCLPHMEPPRAFGGVGRDLRWIGSGGFLFLFVANIPFSLVGDIVTLPQALRTPSWWPPWVPVGDSESQPEGTNSTAPLVLPENDAQANSASATVRPDH